MSELKLANDSKSAPVQASERIEFIDILRGFAVFGILVANMYSYSGVAYEPGAWSGIDRVVVAVTRFLVEAKFYSLFSLLFGWGLAVQLSRAEARGVRFVPLYLRRLMILLILGIVHGTLIWVGDILTTYALLGFVLLLFRQRSGKVLLAGVGLALLFSILMRVPGGAMEAVREGYMNLTDFLRYNTYSHTLYATGTYGEITPLRVQEYLGAMSYLGFFFANVLAMFLLGLYIGKRRIFHQVQQHLGALRKVMWAGLGIGLVFNAIHIWLLLSPDSLPDRYRPVAQVGARTIGAPALMLFYVCGIILLFQSQQTQNERWQRRLAPLSNVGCAALSNYLFQSVLCTFIFYGYGLGLYGEFGPTVALILAVVIYWVQVRLSAWWFDRYRFGPIEWLWRTLTYRKLQPIRLGEAGAERQPPRWLRWLRRVFAGVPPAVALASAWVVLLIWAGGLYAWHGHLESDNLRHQVAVLASQSVEGEGVDWPAAAPAGSPAEPQAHVVATPVVQPVTYEPGPAAASGDLVALAAAFDVEAALTQIQTLSGPPYLGRVAGSPQGRAAGDYIADQFAAVGLQPAGDEGTFFQSFPLEYVTLDQAPTLVIEGPDGTIYEGYRLHQDFAPVLGGYAGPGRASGPVIWGNNCTHEDLDQLDVVGKVLLCRDVAMPTSAWDAAPGEGGTQSVKYPARNALEHGAVALLLLTDPQLHPPDRGNVYFESWVPEPIPVLRIFPNAAEGSSPVKDLMLGSGSSVADLSVSFTPFALNTRARLEVVAVSGAACPEAGCQGTNVLGVIPGRDPTYVGQVLILGAHYDHLGQSPDGLIWAGANNNASGVAVLLEIAHSWRESGYVPRHTVLFAAWDASEMGALGAEYYVQHPRYPLENTVAELQLDMVGAGGETLYVDSSGSGPGQDELDARIRAMAEALEVETAGIDVGNGDHVPFQRAKVPSSLLTWFVGAEGFGQDWLYYARPGDTPERIESSKLEAVGHVVGGFVLGLTEGEPDIANVLAERAAAIEAGDVDAFLNTSQPDQWEADRLWFADVQGLAPTRFEMQAQNVHVAGRHASATVRMTLTYPDKAEEEGAQDITQTENYDLAVRFVFDAQGWHWAGPDLARTDLLTAGLSLAYPPEAEIGELPQWAAERYAEIATLLGVPAEPDKRLTLSLFPSARALRVSTALSLPPSQELWVGSDEVKLVHSPALSDSLKLDHALTALLLNQAGVTPNTAPWLWEGLPLALRAEGALVETHAQYLPQLWEDLTATLPTECEATAWAAVDYLRRQVGWQGIGQFIVALGDACQAGLCPELACGELVEPAEGLDAAFSQVLQIDAGGFETAWQTYWRERLSAAQTGLDAVLTTRVAAILAGERDAFLDTVDPSVPNLVQEQAYWFDQLQLEAPERLTASGEVLALEESLLADVTLEYAFEGGEDESVTMRIAFSPGQNGYRWAGAPLETLPGELVTVLYPQGQTEVAQDIWQQATTVYPQAAAALGVQAPPSLTVKLYPGEAEFRHSLLLDRTRALSDPLNGRWHAWTGAGQSVKLALQEGASPAKDATIRDYAPDLVEQLVRHLLVHMGVDAEWLVKGASLYLSTDLGVSESRFASRLGDVRRAVSKETLYDLGDMPMDYALPAEDVELLRTLAWDTMRYLVYTHDRAALLGVLRAQAQGGDLDQALQTTIGQTLSEFEAAWAASLGRAHLSQEWVEIALGFDEEQVLPHIAFLTSPALAGRQAGAPGAEVAADYVADRFAAYGLLPAGDLVVRGSSPVKDGTGVTATEALTSSVQSVTVMQVLAQDTRTFLQHFPITFTTLLDTPRLDVLDASGQVTAALAYREDFVLALVERTSAEVVEGELVWVGRSNYQGLDLDGKVVLCPATDEMDELVNQATAHGASGLIVVGELENPKDFLVKMPLPFKSVSAGSTSSPQADALPVLELTRPGYERLLEIIGRTPPELLNAPPALTLDFRVRLEIPVSTPERGQTANVLGLLPGSDPALSQQLIILGAHYDHVGDDPARRYAGANDDASGIGVLLEIARLWQENGYRPQRSVLFVAWGAQELGDIGSSYYVRHPLFPLAQTAAMLQLDAVGGGAGHYMEAEGLRDTEGQLLFSMEAAEDLVDGRLQLTAPREKSLLSEEQDVLYISVFEGVSSQWVKAKQSDNAPFRLVGIPTLLVTWRGASEDNWPVEIADEVEPYRLGVTGRMVTLVMMSVAR